MRNSFSKNLFHDSRGMSIIGTMLTLIVLGVMGATIVGLVATEQETRKLCLWRERAFYSVQAGLEYVLREINQGGYPIVTDKQFADATFTSSIDPGPRKITVTGEAGDAARTHSITTDLLAKDCVAINASGAALGGSYQNELTGIVVDQTCLMAVNMDKMTVSWTPNYGGTVRRIRINGQDVYDESVGLESGQQIDITDSRFSGQVPINTIVFSNSMEGTSIDIAISFTDSSSILLSGINP
ncbi:MAG: hypothetical protein WC551_12355 [Patescibacteria group bacterium]